MVWIQSGAAGVIMVLISMCPQIVQECLLLDGKTPWAQSNEILKVMVPYILQVTNSWQSSMAYLFILKIFMILKKHVSSVDLQRSTLHVLIRFSVVRKSLANTLCLPV